MTEWLLKAALRQWTALSEQGFNTHLAFNISALSLRDPYLPNFLQKACERHGMPCGYLAVEVTESATQHVVRLLDTLSRIRLKGMGLALDDFGTGYSSLLQLRQLPYSELKIDRAFVGDALLSSESRLIIQAIVASPAAWASPPPRNASRISAPSQSSANSAATTSRAS